MPTALGVALAWSLVPAQHQPAKVATAPPRQARQPMVFYVPALPIDIERHVSPIGQPPSRPDLPRPSPPRPQLLLYVDIPGDPAPPIPAALVVPVITFDAQPVPVTKPSRFALEQRDDEERVDVFAGLAPLLYQGLSALDVSHLPSLEVPKQQCRTERFGQESRCRVSSANADPQQRPYPRGGAPRCRPSGPRWLQRAGEWPFGRLASLCTRRVAPLSRTILRVAGRSHPSSTSRIV